MVVSSPECGSGVNFFLFSIQCLQVKHMEMFIRVLKCFSLPAQANIWVRVAGFCLLCF